MSTTEDVPKVAIDQAVHAAYVAEEYVDEDGVFDPGKLRDAIFAVVSEAVVENAAPKERRDKAVTKGDLTARVFPHLAQPEPGGDALTEAVWNAVVSKVWNQTGLGAGGRLQQMIGVNMGSGWVMCKTKVGINGLLAVYVTRNVACIEQDFVTPENDALQRKAASYARNMEMLVMRQPANGRRYLRDADRTTKGLDSAVHAQLVLAVEMAGTGNGNGSGAPAGGDELPAAVPAGDPAGE